MLTGAICTCDTALSDHLVDVARQSELLEVSRVLSHKVQNYELVRTVNGLGLDVVMLDFADGDAASGQAEVLKKQAPQAARIGFLSNQPGLFEDNPAPDLVDAWMPMPPDAAAWNRTLWQAAHRPEGVLRTPLFAYLPAKAGSGSTTLSMHLADILANEIGRPTILLDADSLSGITALLLNVEPRNSLRDVLAQSVQLSSSLWASAVQTVGRLDVLCNRLEQNDPPPTWAAYWKLLRFASSRYEAIVVDLPERVNEATMELTYAAEAILVVTTMELASLKLAERRLLELRSRGVRMDRVKLVLNRWHRRDLSRENVEKLLSTPVAGVVPNDYLSMQKAVQSSGFVSAESKPGQAFRELANSLAGIKAPPPSARESLFSLFR